MYITLYHSKYTYIDRYVTINHQPHKTCRADGRRGPPWSRGGIEGHSEVRGQSSDSIEPGHRSSMSHPTMI